MILPIGSGGNVITLSATAPASPNVGDEWIDIVYGYGLVALYIWTGSAWQNVKVGQVGDGVVGTTNIVSGAVTSSLIADGAVGTSQIAAAAITSALLASKRVGTVQHRLSGHHSRVPGGLRGARQYRDRGNHQ